MLKEKIMSKLRVYSSPFYENERVLNPYIDLNAKKSFRFYINYQFSDGYISEKPFRNIKGYYHRRSTAEECLSRFRRTVLFSDSTALIPLPYLDLTFGDLHKRACHSKSLSHSSNWITNEGAKFLMTEPYNIDDYFFELLNEVDLVAINVPRDLSPYCGIWTNSPVDDPGSKSYLIADKKDIGELENIQIQLQLALIGAKDNKASLPPRWNCTKGILYV